MGAKRHLHGGTQEGTYIQTDTDRHTDGHHNFMTESARCADSVKMAKTILVTNVLSYFIIKNAFFDVEDFSRIFDMESPWCRKLFPLGKWHGTFG